MPTNVRIFVVVKPNFDGHITLHRTLTTAQLIEYPEAPLRACRGRPRQPKHQRLQHYQL